MKKTTTKVEVMDPRWEKFIFYYAETGNCIQSGIKAGFNEHYAKQLVARYPDKVKKGLSEIFTDEFLREKHLELFKAGRLDQMTFPLERNQSKMDKLIDENEVDEDDIDNINILQGELLSDKDIVDMLEATGVKVKRIVPMYGLRHVFFWTPDNMARDKALDKAYKLRGSYAPINTVNVNVDGNKLFTDEQRTKTRSAIKGYLGRGNR